MTTVVVLVAAIAPLSIIAFGSPAALLPEMSRIAISNGWMTSREFAEIYAIAQAAPGPNLTFYAALGWRAGGFPAALAAEAAMIVPPAALIYIVDHAWPRRDPPRWAVAIERGVAPIAVGFIGASGFEVALAADRSPVAYLITAGAALVAYKTRMHLLLVVATAALLGLTGIVG